MLVSMTGFGQAEVSNRSAKVSVEIRTVNHRFLDISSKLPKALLQREHEIKEMLKERISRGRVSVTISAETEMPKYSVSINIPLMEQYMDQLQQFAKTHSLGANLEINTLATLPEVFTLHENENDSEVLWPLVKKMTQLSLRWLIHLTLSR